VTFQCRGFFVDNFGLGFCFCGVVEEEEEVFKPKEMLDGTFGERQNRGPLVRGRGSFLGLFAKPNT
jgi:hypothetical protein